MRWPLVLLALIAAAALTLAGRDILQPDRVPAPKSLTTDTPSPSTPDPAVQAADPQPDPPSPAPAPAVVLDSPQPTDALPSAFVEPDTTLEHLNPGTAPDSLAVIAGPGPDPAPTNPLPSPAEPSAAAADPPEPSSEPRILAQWINARPTLPTPSPNPPPAPPPAPASEPTVTPAPTPPANVPTASSDMPITNAVTPLTAESQPEPEPEPEVEVEPEPPAVTPLRIYDATSYSFGPEVLSQPAYQRLRLLYPFQFWPRGHDRSEVHHETVRRLAESITEPNGLVCINVEHWHAGHHDPAIAEAAIDRYVDLLRTFREHAPPGTRIGLYAMLPHRDYWAPVLNRPDELAHWERRNRRLDRLAQEVDVIFPSLYTFYDDLPNWTVYAEANIAAAKAYGKPVIPFLWPQYHISNPELARTDIPGDDWAHKLRTTLRHTRQLVIWDHRPDWHRVDPDRPWWSATLSAVEQAEAAQLAAFD
ncbi:MAG: hypothetical protein AAF797_16490 [Planctomycetota bacterium]